MNKSHSSPRTRFTFVVLSIAGLLIVIFMVAPAALVAPQGKGGQVVSKPTPTPKKTPTRRSTPSRTTTNTKPNPSKKPSGDAATAAEIVFWNSIKDSANPEDFRAYLKNYPSGQFADLANNRIKILEAAKPQPTATPTPTPTPTPEPAYEWTKVERDLPAPVRVEWREEEKLTFSVPSGWTRTRREEGKHYLQLSFRSPDSAQTNISIQLYSAGVPHTLRNNSAEFYRSVNEFIGDRRKEYASQTVSAKLTDPEVINHPTGRWLTFTADFLDASVIYIPIKLDAIYPSDIWEKKYYGSGNDSYSVELLKPSSVTAITNTRHSYAIRSAGSYGAILVLLYTAPIDKFDEKMLPSVMATLKMPDGKITVKAVSSDPSVILYPKYEPDIMIDGERKGAYQIIGSSAGVGKHRITVSAKEHKTFEKDIFVGGWEAVELDVKLERIATGTTATKPE